MLFHVPAIWAGTMNLVHPRNVGMVTQLQQGMYLGAGRSFLDAGSVGRPEELKKAATGRNNLQGPRWWVPRAFVRKGKEDAIQFPLPSRSGP